MLKGNPPKNCKNEMKLTEMKLSMKGYEMRIVYHIQLSSLGITNCKLLSTLSSIILSNLFSVVLPKSSINNVVLEASFSTVTFYSILALTVMNRIFLIFILDVSRVSRGMHSELRKPEGLLWD